MHLLFNVRCAKESYRSPFTLNCCTWHLLLSLGCPSSSRAHDIMRQEKMYLDGHCLGVEVSHKLVQGSKVLLNLLCKVPAGRLILLHSILTCLSLAHMLDSWAIEPSTALEHIKPAPALCHILLCFPLGRL